MLGLLDQAGRRPRTTSSGWRSCRTFNFWTVPHTQLYTECARLAEAGLLDEQPRADRPPAAHLPPDRRAGARRCTSGAASRRQQLYELRDASTLKLFFGGDPAALAAAQLEAHKRRLEIYERAAREPRTARPAASGWRWSAGSATSASSSASGRGCWPAATTRARTTASRLSGTVLLGRAQQRGGAGPSSSVTKRSGRRSARPARASPWRAPGRRRRRRRRRPPARWRAARGRVASRAPAPVVQRLHAGAGRSPRRAGRGATRARSCR